MDKTTETKEKICELAILLCDKTMQIVENHKDQPPERYIETLRKNCETLVELVKAIH